MGYRSIVISSAVRRSSIPCTRVFVTATMLWKSMKKGFVPLSLITDRFVC